MKGLKYQLVIGFVCIILGLMISLQFKSMSGIRSKYSYKRIEDLVSEVETLRKQRDELSSKVQEYQKKVDEIEKAVASESEVANQMKKEIDSLRFLSGLTDVEGPGIIMTLTPSNDVKNSETSMIYSTDLIDIVNELNAAGAEAISINEQRYVGRTQIKEAGATIKINDEKFSPIDTFVIKAIGDPKVLEGAFKIPGGIKDKLEELAGINVKITKSDNIKILKYNKSIDYKYVK
ncbi:DUF881 domain-containing protein [Caloramator sp. E03]|uniref:DUF881 domain-containing protein n=1 Tax=Caloramator sp. E03 TaxID=2576307 RepID=UPI0011103594|nr:DUF881 domain-containing protein [Caloramator sp. E03]QCX32579.1 DUF881 domain-containing protein [Caloramator sp. E03]